MQASLSPERWDQVQRLFDEVIELAPADRARRLDEACRHDPTLREEVESLLEALGQADELLKSLDQWAPPAALSPEAAPPSRAGTRVGHYDVLEHLGSGGMGVVYKAFDTRLKRTVALKFLPPGLSFHPEARSRFEHEAQAASALDHPNICTIYEIGAADDGQAFIAMACYDGQTLKQKIADGLLPLTEALAYAAQMARGLERAHEAGIIHRDVKPANVIVTERGVVKVLDFGLAKMHDVQLTQTGTTLGTVSYMSPEQALGAPVDPRTDLWSLGVVLYEMLTGKRPFQGDYEQALLYAVVNEDPPLPSTINADLPKDLERVVMTCLEKDRDRRYPTMADLLADLEVFVQQPARSALLRATWRRRKVGSLVASLGALLVLVLLALPPVRQAVLGGFVAPEEQRLAVLPFVNNLGDTPGNQALADGLTQSLTSMIARIGTQESPISVVPVEEVILKGILSADDARKRFGVNRVLRGSLQRLGQQTELILNLVDPDPAHTRILATQTLRAPLSPSFQVDALRALEGLLAVNLDADARLAVNLGGPSAPGAYAFYLQGMGYLQRYDKAANIDNAITLFTRAIEADPFYALAHAGLCEATWEKYRKTNDTKLADAALAHCDRAAHLAAEQPPVLITLGNAYLRTGQNEKAEATLLQARALEPDNAEIYRWLGRVYEEQAQTDRAEEAYRKALALKPNVWIYSNLLGILLYYSGRYEDAIPHLERARRLTPDNPDLYTMLALARRNMNQVEEAKQLFQRAIALQPTVYAYRGLGALYYREQQYDEAVQAYTHAIDLQETDFVAWSWLGHAYYWAGDSTQARAAWQRTLDLALPQLDVNPTDDDVLCLVADAYLALGNRDQGAYFLELLLAQPHSAVLIQYYVGRMYEMLGRRDLALDWIEQALEKTFDPYIPDRDPWLKALRTDPRYQTLRARFSDKTKEIAS